MLERITTVSDPRIRGERQTIDPLRTAECDVLRQFSPARESERTISNDVLPTLMQLGNLKSQGVSREDPRIRELDRKHFAAIQTMMSEKSGTTLGDKIIAYHGTLQAYAANETPIDPFEESVRDIMQPTFVGQKRFADDIEKHRIGLLISTHPAHTADMDMMDWREGRVLHDVWPVATTIAFNASLEGSGLKVRKFVKSAYEEDEFMKRSREDVGNIRLEKGTDQIAAQMKLVASQGEVPLLYPEGGFRMLQKWNSGAVVVAVKAGFDHIFVATQSPVDSLLEPEMTTQYIGMQPIPLYVAEAVHQEDKSTVIDFSQSIKTSMAKAVQMGNYPSDYASHLLSHA